MTPCSPSPRSRMRSEYKRSKVGFPIRRSSDQSSFAAPQGLSQRTTSFIASQRQGIHQMLFRHLIALMIHAHPSLQGPEGQSAKADDQKDRLRISPKTCLPNTTGRAGGPKAASWCGGAKAPNRSCSLFTMSNIRKARHRRPANPKTLFGQPSRHACMVEPRTLGGARRDRTDDLKLAKLALSQLSYGPILALPRGCATRKPLRAANPFGPQGPQGRPAARAVARNSQGDGRRRRRLRQPNKPKLSMAPWALPRGP